MTPLDVPHHTDRGGPVLWLIPTTCLQQAIPFPTTLQQPKADAVTLPPFPSSSSSAPHPLQVTDVLFGLSAPIHRRAWAGELWFWTPDYLYFWIFNLVVWLLIGPLQPALSARQPAPEPLAEWTWASQTHLTSEPWTAISVCRPGEDKGMARHPIYCLPDGFLITWWSTSLMALVVFAPVNDTATVFTAEKRAEINVMAN